MTAYQIFSKDGKAMPIGLSAIDLLANVDGDVLPLTPVSSTP